MPELPEVEVVRRGLDGHVVGRTVAAVELRGTRVARRHVPGPDDLAGRLRGCQVRAAHRRGKYLWLAVGEAGSATTHALLIHLGMSGQLLVARPGAPDERHLHARFSFVDEGPELRFVDQRTFGGLGWSDLGVDGLPEAIRHIAADPFDPAFDETAVVRAMKARRSAVKRVLLDQRTISGIGNIYADEALWRARVHGERLASGLAPATLHRIVAHASDVMREALAEGGTSFDSLYVDVNGASGYFSRSLDVYDRAGEPCRRCGSPIRRVAFMNRSSHFCPRCQRER